MEGKETFESCWSLVQTKALDKLQSCLLSSSSDCNFSRKDYSLLYTTVYNLCIDTTMDYSHLIYQRYNDMLIQYLQSYVVPSLKNLQGNNLLINLQKHWRNHNFMVNWLSKFFQYLDRFYVNSQGLLSLKEKGMEIFTTTVFLPIKIGRA